MNVSTMKLGGCLPPNQPVARILNGRDDLGDLFGISWHQHLSVSDEQHEGSCVGRGYANRLEMAIHQATEEKVQLDAYAIWKRGRELFHKGTLNGGLAVRQGLDACYDLGIIGQSAAEAEGVPLYAEAIHGALMKAPLIQGHTAHDGWAPENLNPENGAIDESQPYTWGTNGHCTVTIAWSPHGGRQMIGSANSWGTDYGPLGGVFFMTIEHWLATALDNPIMLLIDPDWWTKSKVWRKYVIAPGTKVAPR